MFRQDTEGGSLPSDLKPSPSIFWPCLAWGHTLLWLSHRAHLSNPPTAYLAKGDQCLPHRSTVRMVFCVHTSVYAWIDFFLPCCRLGSPIPGSLPEHLVTISNWIGYYTTTRFHQVLNKISPTEIVCLPLCLSPTCDVLSSNACEALGGYDLPSVRFVCPTSPYRLLFCSENPSLRCDHLLPFPHCHSCLRSGHRSLASA